MHGCGESAGAYRSQNKLSGPLELDSQVVVSCVAWVLQTKLVSFVRAANTQLLSSLSSPHKTDTFGFVFVSIYDRDNYSYRLVCLEGDLRPDFFI